MVLGLIGLAVLVLCGLAGAFVVLLRNTHPEWLDEEEDN